MDKVGNSDSLWLEREPTAEEVKAEFARFDMDNYDEVVFCGFGEPTEALDVVLEVAAYVKENFRNDIRLNTNGLGSLIRGENIAPLLQGLVDTVSISLNNPHADEYHALVRSKFGDRSFDAMLEFAEQCTKYVPQVVMTTVDTTISHEEEEECRQICEKIGAAYRIRPWEE
jgi:TatD family-associated radical SAM protein